MAKSTSVPKKPVAAATQKEKSSAGFKIPGTKVLCLILAILAFCTYANTFNNGYVIDDQMMVVENRIVNKGFSGIGELLSTPYMRGYGNIPNDHYRPLSLVTLAIEVGIFGVNPHNNHVVNVLLFVCCLLILFLFLLRFLGEGKIGVAFVTCLLFAVHPIHTEVVSNVKSRDELLCFLFSFSALYLFLKHARSGTPWQLVVGALCYFLSLLCKETSIAFLAVIPGIFLLYKDAEKKRSWFIIAASVVAVGAFLVLRHYILEINHADNEATRNFMDNELVYAKNLGIRLATAMLVLGNYIKLIFVPYPLVCSYEYNSIPFTGFGNIWVLLSLAAYLAIFSFAVYRMVKNRKDLLAFGILFWIVMLGLFSNFFILIGATMAERFLFFPSVGFCLVVALMLEMWIAKAGGSDIFTSAKTWLIIGPVSLVFLVMTVNRNAEWKDNMTLFKADVEKMPENARLNYYLGNEMSTVYANFAPDAATKKQIITESLPYLQKAVHLYPKYDQAQTTLATAFFNLQIYDSAEVHHKAALANDPVNALALNGLAGIYFMKQNFPAAREILIRDVAINPSNVPIMYNLGLCYLNMRQFDSAIAVYRRVLAIAPGHKETVVGMQQAFTLLNMPDSAAKYGGGIVPAK